MILAPRRGSKTVMESEEKGNIVLAEGEIFFELDRVLNIVRIKMGDGETKYSELPYITGNTAADTVYDPSGSSLMATNTQDAIDNLASIVHGITQIILEKEYSCAPNSSITIEFDPIDTTRYIPIGVAGYNTNDMAMTVSGVCCSTDGEFIYSLICTNTVNGDINTTAELLISAIPIN